MDNLARDILSVNEEIAGRHATVAGGADGAPEMIWGSPEMGAVLDLVGKVASRPASHCYKPLPLGRSAMVSLSTAFERAR